MWPVSDAFLARLRRSHTITAVVEYDQGDDDWRPLRLVDGTAEADAEATSRWSITATVADDEDARAVSPFGSRLRAFRGVLFPDGSRELVPLGVCRVESVKHEHGAATRDIEADSLEAALDDAQFLAPRSVHGGSAVATITTLIREVLPDAPVHQRVPDRVVGSLTEDTDRWGLISGSSSGGGDEADLATLLGGRVYCDNTGGFVIGPVPRIAEQPVWTADSGVTVSHGGELSREDVVNVVVAEGAQGTEPMDDPDDDGDTDPGEVPDPGELPDDDGDDDEDGEPDEDEVPGPAFAWDDDPDSPTYAGARLDDPHDVGPFGRVVEHYSSSALTNMGDCQRAAHARLAAGLGIRHSVDLDVVVNPALQPGDTIRIAVPGQPASLHLVEKLSIPLGTTATMSLDTRADREVASAAPRADAAATPENQPGTV